MTAYSQEVHHIPASSANPSNYREKHPEKEDSTEKVPAHSKDPTPGFGKFQSFYHRYNELTVHSVKNIKFTLSKECSLKTRTRASSRA